MKRKIFLTLTTITVLMFVACEKDDDGQNEIKGIITMTTEKHGYFYDLIVAGRDTITIEVGGQKTSNPVPKEMEGAFINYDFGGIAVNGGTITITGHITGFMTMNNQLTYLDVSGCRTLVYLGCVANQLTSLDVSSNTALEYLFCPENQLTSLDVSNNKSLKYRVDALKFQNFNQKVFVPSGF